VQLASGVAVHVPLSAEDGFRVTDAKLRRKLTPRSKLLIVNSPNNPTGRVFTREELETIASVALENDLLVLSDEIYEKILYDDHEHISIGSLPDMRERTMVINGFSKTYAMTGWRLGFGIMPEALARRIGLLLTHSVGCTATFTQYAGLEAVTGPQEQVDATVSEYQRRRDALVGGLNAIPGLRCQRPQGAFYAFPNITAFGRTSDWMADYLLEQAGVAVLPGTAFGPGGEGYLRLCFANSMDRIELALARIGAALGKLDRT
jgi:aspartate/methionine/tyrosine aminotransferase